MLLLTVIILHVSVFSICSQLISCDRLFLIESFALLPAERGFCGEFSRMDSQHVTRGTSATLAAF